MELESTPVMGILLALASAAALSIGNLLQGHGVHTMEARMSAGATGSRAVHLIRNHFWLLGGLCLIISILLQMGALTFAPLMVVQPVGVTALVFTVLLTAIVLKRMPSRAALVSIAVSVIGVAAFVTVAALVSTQSTITDTQLIAVLVVLAWVLLLTGAVVWFNRGKTIRPIMWVILGAIYSAFVATLGKTVILRVQTALKQHSFSFDLANVLTIFCIIGIGVAGFLSIYFVQRAHAVNRPDVVVAGLTVIDPTIAVVLGITILGEAMGAPLWSIFAFVVTGAIAVAGVFGLSRAEQGGQEPGSAAAGAKPAAGEQPPAASKKG